MVGADGAQMLALSCAILLATGGLSLIGPLVAVVRAGWRAPSVGSEAARILVLGHRPDAGGVPSRRFVARLARAAALARSDEAAILFVLGGRTRAGVESEASLGEAWLVAHGVAREKIRREDTSRHTLENLRHYRRDHGAAALGAPVLLVSSRVHLARASMMAAQLGIAHRPVAAEAGRASSLLRDAPRILLEALLVHWYVTGRTFSRLTGNARMLGRIS